MNVNYRGIQKIMNRYADKRKLNLPGEMHVKLHCSAAVGNEIELNVTERKKKRE